MKPMMCDMCDDPTLARYLVQDIATGDSVTACDNHFGEYCMNVAEQFVNAQMGATEPPNTASQHPKSADTNDGAPAVPAQPASDQRGNDSMDGGPATIRGIPTASGTNGPHPNSSNKRANAN